MVEPIHFWMQVQHTKPSLTQKIAAYAESYLSLSSKVAVVVPGFMEEGSLGVRICEQQTPLWITALKVASYFTGILPTLAIAIKIVSRISSRFHVCEQTLPDGTKEIGAFARGILHSGTRTRNGESIFVNPKFFINKDYPVRFAHLPYLAEVFIDGKNKAAFLQRQSSTPEETYVLYQGSIRDAILEIGQMENSAPLEASTISHALKHALVHQHTHQIKAEEVRSLFTRNSQGETPLHNMGPNSLLGCLSLARKLHIPIDLNTIHTLFTHCVTRNYEEVVKFLLETTPSAIRQIRNLAESPLTRALMQGHEKMANTLFEALQKEHVELTPQEKWLMQAKQQSCSKEELQGLTPDLQRQVFQVANFYNNKKILQQFRDLGMHRSPSAPYSDSILSHDMDAIDIEKALESFFKDLRIKGILVTHAEFQQHSISYDSTALDAQDLCKHRYLEHLVQQKNLSHIALPKLQVVLPQREPSLMILVGKHKTLCCSALEICMEKIEKVDRKATRQEVSELLDWLESIEGRCAMEKYNLFIGKDKTGQEKLYISPYEARQSPNKETFICANLSLTLLHRKLPSCLNPADHAWLQQELQRRPSFQPDALANQIRSVARDSRDLPSLESHGFSNLRKPFMLDTRRLLTS